MASISAPDAHSPATGWISMRPTETGVKVTPLCLCVWQNLKMSDASLGSWDPSARYPSCCRRTLGNNESIRLVVYGTVSKLALWYAALPRYKKKACASRFFRKKRQSPNVRLLKILNVSLSLVVDDFGGWH